MKKSVDRRSFMKIAGSSLGIGVLYTALPMPVVGEAREMMHWLGQQNGEKMTPFSLVQLSDPHVGFNGPPADNILAGQKNFSQYCMVCHGLDGQNTGLPFADRTSPPVPRLNSAAVQKYTDGQLKWIIDNGIFPSGMPASKGILNDDEMWQIVDYIRHLPLKGSLGEPPVYSGN